MSTADLYIVRGRRNAGSVTYRCPTAEWALRKLSDFRLAGYEDITAIAPDGTAVTEASLAKVVEAAEEGHRHEPIQAEA